MNQTTDGIELHYGNCVIQLRVWPILGAKIQLFGIWQLIGLLWAPLKFMEAQNPQWSTSSISTRLMQDHTLTFRRVYCSRRTETIPHHTHPAPPLFSNTQVPVPLVNPHPPQPCTHPPTHPPTRSPHLNEHRNARGMTQSHQMLKPGGPAPLSPDSTAALMNGHSEMQTKLSLDLYYTPGSGVTQSSDRGRKQKWMPISRFQTTRRRKKRFLQTKTLRRVKECSEEELLIIVILSPPHRSSTCARL